MAAFGGSTAPGRLIRTSSAPGSFPKAASSYTSADGAVIVPHGALDRWFAYRSPAKTATTRRDVVIFGDSTTFGSGGNYSWVQRLRARSVAAGYADGGKGIFAGSEDLITYDSPEVNGIVSSTFGGGFPDTYDTLTGAFLYDTGSPANHVMALQFGATGARLWYMQRPAAGAFQYSVNGGAPVTVNANVASGTPAAKYVVLSGLAANTTHTITITNTGGSGCYIALAPLNATGIVYQKQAVSGATFGNFFTGGAGAPPYTQSLEGFRYQNPLGLLNASVGSSTAYQGAAVDTSQAAADRINPVLAISHLGFNDLSNSSSTDLPAWAEYVKRFAGACRDASCDGMIISGQLPYNANWATYGAARFAALRDTAVAQGLAFVDLFYPIGGPALSYAGGATNPHLTRTQYETQGDYLWDGALGL